ADGSLYLDAPVARATAIETLARALMNRLRSSVATAAELSTSSDSKPSNAKRDGTSRVPESTHSQPRSAVETEAIASLTFDTADGVSEGRLLVAPRRRIDGGLEARGSSRRYLKVESDASRLGVKDHAAVSDSSTSNRAGSPGSAPS